MSAGNLRRDRVHHLAAGDARRHALRVGGKYRQSRHPSRRAVRRASAAAIHSPAPETPSHTQSKRRVHSASACAPRSMRLAKMRQRRGRHEKRRIDRPAELLLGLLHVLDAERRAVRLEAVLFGRAVADVRAHENQRGPLRLGAARPRARHRSPRHRCRSQRGSCASRRPRSAWRDPRKRSCPCRRRA